MRNVRGKRFEELIRHRRALLVLAAMAGEEPYSMSEFTRVSRLVPERARELRHALEQMGLLKSEVVAPRGMLDLLSIRLTPLGRKVAEHALAIEELLEGDPGRAPER